MQARKQIQPNEKVPLTLTATERKLVLNDVTCLDQEYEQIIQSSPAGKPVMLTLDELDEFGGYVAAEANHCDDTKKQKKLDAVFQKVQSLLETYTDEEQPQTINFEDAKRAKLISDQAAQVAEWLAQALITAEQLRIKTKPLDDFCLAPAQRDVLLLSPSLPKSIRNKLAKDKKPFTVAEVASMGLSLAEDLTEGDDTHKHLAIMMVAQHLMNRLQEGITRLGKAKSGKQPKAKSKAATGTLYQFKITLLESAPPIWRRIQVHDCTLDEFHEHIQTAMGWTNSHLHQFEIEGERFGDPELLDDGFQDFECVDSTVTMVSDILPESGKRFAFKYEYDFGDCWEHEILFEGCPPAEKRKKYPLCLEGERACPPEDCGGVWGYQDFLAAIADPKHEEHESFLEWCGGSFSPDEFDVKAATREMKKGLPDW